MQEAKQAKRNPLGCALVVAVLVAAVVGGGLLLNRMDKASKTGCERYAEIVARELDNCHSGQNRSHRHLIGQCQQSIDPSAACFERIDALSCDQLERGVPASAGEVCRKGQ